MSSLKDIVEGRSPKKATPVGERVSVIALIEEVLEGKRKHYRFFRPSMLFGCDRANVFHYMRAPSHPPRFETNMMRILDNGTAVHSVIQGYLANLHGWFFSPEVKVQKKVKGALIRGSSDGVLENRLTGQRIGIEIKTISSTQFLKLTKPKEWHVRQATVYGKLMGVPSMVILYWEKNSHVLKEFYVDIDGPKGAKVWREIEDRVTGLLAHVEKKTLPKYNPTTCDTKFCGFVDYCRKKGAPV